MHADGQKTSHRFTHWQKSSYNNPNGNSCVEITFDADAVGVRDSKLGDASPVLAFTAAQWRAFLATQAPQR